ncbi:MAG: hypothetical protein ABII88_02560 [Candidatus Omnitrophota bacterium]
MHWTFYLTAIYMVFALSMLIYRLYLIKKLHQLDPKLLLYKAYISRSGCYYCLVRTRVGYIATGLLLVASYLLYLGYISTTIRGATNEVFAFAGVLLISLSFVKMCIWPWSRARVVIGITGAPRVEDAWGRNLVNFWKITQPPFTSPWFIIFNENYPPRGYTGRLIISKWQLGAKEFNLLKKFLDDIAIKRTYTPTVTD